MAQDVQIIRPQGNQVKALPEIAPVGQEALRTTQRLGQALGQIGDTVWQRVEDNAFMQAQTSLSREMARIERDNLGNPDGLQKSLTAYKKSFMKEVKIPALRSRLDYQFEAQAIPALNRAHAQFRQNVDQETQANTFLSMDEIQNQMDVAAQGAFSEDPNIRASSMGQMQELMERQVALANQRSSDGSFLFGPEAVANMTIAARDKTHTTLVKNWFLKQPNKLQAAEDWLNGGLEYDLPNSPDALGGFDSMDANHLFENGLLAQESGGRQFDANGNVVTSPVGATGIAQIMPATGPEAAALAGVKWDPKRFKNDAAYNKQLGKAYFDAQVQKYGNTTLALMAYNAGPGAVDDFMNGTNKTGKNPDGKKLGDPRNGETSINAFVNAFPFKETRDYVRGVKEKAGFTPVNIRESMPASTRQKVDNEVMAMLQDQIAIENHQMALQERADKNLAQQTMGDWVTELSGAPREKTFDDVLNEVTGTKTEPSQGMETNVDDFYARRQEQITRLDAQKQIFIKGGMQDEYFALRKSLVSGNPLVEDGATIVQMKNMMARGQDISQIALGALNGNRIGPDTYDELLSRQKTLRGPAGDAPQFLLNQIQSSIAGLTPTGDPNSAVLVYNAQTQFLNAVDQWKTDPANAGKVPTLKDLKPLADSAISSFNPNPEGAVVSLTAPSYIPANLYSAPSVEGVAKMQQLVKEQYVKKHGKDVEKIKNDPDFKRDFNWVKTIEKTVTPSSTSVGE